MARTKRRGGEEPADELHELLASADEPDMVDLPAMEEPVQQPQTAQVEMIEVPVVETTLAVVESAPAKRVRKGAVVDNNPDRSSVKMDIEKMLEEQKKVNENLMTGLAALQERIVGPQQPKTDPAQVAAVKQGLIELGFTPEAANFLRSGGQLPIAVNPQAAAAAQRTPVHAGELTHVIDVTWGTVLLGTAAALVVIGGYFLIKWLAA